MLIRLGEPPRELIVSMPGAFRIRDVLEVLGLPAATTKAFTCSGNPLPLQTLVRRDACVKLVVTESPG